MPDTPEIGAARPPDAPRKRAPRTTPPSRKLRTLDDLDQRTAAARRAREFQVALTRDLGDDPSAAEAALVSRAATLTAFCAHCEAEWLSAGGALDSSYLGATKVLRGILEALGLKRVPRPVEAHPETTEALSARDRSELREYLAGLPADQRAAEARKLGVEGDGRD